jgi:hypothetical protein
MYGTYRSCENLTGKPVCGPNVTSMHSTYRGCYNLKESPVCGPNVTIMLYAYDDCTSLTGNPVCGDKVTTMYAAYSNCHNLTGSPVCGPNVTTVNNAYYNCPNLSSNGYFYSNKITDVGNCFGEKNTSKRLNLYVPANSTTLTTCLYSNFKSLVGASITWTNDTANNRYYNTAQNIYIYPVDNVAQVYEVNEK